MKTYIAYVRVSTTRQAETGTSLAEQHRSIESYALKEQLHISEWFEETETAAKSGRSVFRTILRRLDQSCETGLLIHKIDRGARNLRDWADLGELLDRGVDVRFTHEDLSLGTRGGRLAADLQAVIAADYIRNLREEVKKGIYGRLKQGLYPWGAPIGYCDCGGGRAKMPDPVLAPLVIAAFERYATGRYSLTAIAGELGILGLRTKTDHVLTASALSHILRRPFYAGICRVKGALYPGVHQPLVSEQLFDRVQIVLKTRRSSRRRACHTFRYQHQLRCLTCKRQLVGERHKELVYYRCHACPGMCVREDRAHEVASDRMRIEKLVLPLKTYSSSTPIES